MPNKMNISELVAGGYKQAACVSPFYPGLGMIKTMTIFVIQGFLMVQAYQRSGFLGVWFVRIQVLRWGQVFQFSDFLRFGVSGLCVYRGQVC